MSSHSSLSSDSKEIFLGRYFPSFVHLENALKELSNNKGFSYVKRSTKRSGDGVSRAVLICSRGYTFPKSKKNAKPRKGELCPFKIIATRCESTHLLKITTFVETHNHPMVDLTAQFSARNRRLTQADQAEILELKAANVKVADIITILTNRSTKYITNRQIYNALCSGAQEKVTGMSECGKLLAFVSSSSELSGFYSAKETPLELETPLRSVFIYFNQNISRFQKAPQVILIDGTFGTNRFNLPITMFVSKDSHDIMYCLGFSLTSTQTTEDYVWALRSFVRSVGKEAAKAIEVVFTDRELALCNAVEHVLPHSNRQLCQWHIRKDAAAYVSKRLDLNNEAKMAYLAAFNGLIGHRDLAKYPAARDALLENFPGCASYTKSWLLYEKHFVECFVATNFNLAIRTTQGVESIHNALKRLLGYTSVPLQILTETFLKKNQASVNRALHCIYASQTSTRQLPPILASTSGALSSPAVLLLLKQVNRLELRDYEVFSHGEDIIVSPKENRLIHSKVSYAPSAHSRCSCCFYMQHRLPCVHVLACFKQFKTALPLASVHPRWLICASGTSTAATLADTPRQAEASRDVAAEQQQSLSLSIDLRSAVEGEEDTSDLFEESLQEFCSLCYKQKQGGLDASHMAALPKGLPDNVEGLLESSHVRCIKALDIVREAFGERRTIGVNAASVSDISQARKRGRPRKLHRLKAANEDDVNHLMHLTQSRTSATKKV